MAKAKCGRRYTPEFRRQMVDLVHSGRSMIGLANEFDCSYWSIRSWLRQAERDGGQGDGGLTSPERKELTRLRRENRRLKMERDILAKAAAWFAQESTPNSTSSSDS